MPRKGGKRVSIITLLSTPGLANSLILQRKTHTHVETGGSVPVDNNRGAIGDGMGEKDIPRSLVVRASKVTPTLRVLIRDIRRLMSPYTALNLKEKRYIARSTR